MGDTVAAGGFGPVEGFIRCIDQLAGLRRDAVHAADANTDTHLRPMRPLRRRDRMADTLGQMHGMLLIRLRQDERELLAAIARDAIGRARRIPQQRADLAQHRIAHRMAITIVQPLEMVDIEH